MREEWKEVSHARVCIQQRSDATVPAYRSKFTIVKLEKHVV
jgi:hypothetical protein